MNNVHRFPVIESDRIAREADDREQVMWAEQDLHIARMNDAPQPITNKDVWALVIDGTVPCIAAAAFLGGIIIGILEKLL